MLMFFSKSCPFQGGWYVSVYYNFAAICVTMCTKSDCYCVIVLFTCNKMCACYTPHLVSCSMSSVYFKTTLTIYISIRANWKIIMYEENLGVWNTTHQLYVSINYMWAFTWTYIRNKQTYVYILSMKANHVNNNNRSSNNNNDYDAIRYVSSYYNNNARGRINKCPRKHRKQVHRCPHISTVDWQSQ